MSEEDPKRVVLLQALSAVTGARQKSYGGPAEAFPIAAELTRVYDTLRKSSVERRGEKYSHDATDQILHMILVKIARLITTPSHGDSWRDIAGYAACGAEVSGSDLTDMPVTTVQK